MNYYSSLRRIFSTFPANIRAFDQDHGFFAVSLALLAVLLAQNPFAAGSYIANLYPYPDTIHYINPALSLLSGKGFKITRMGKAFSPDVPPLYSLVLLPFFAIYNDPRMFYFANLGLTFVSLFLFYLILLKLFDNCWIRTFLLLVYVTNLILHIYPLLAMAENLILPLFLTAVYLLIEKVTLKKSLLAGLITISFYATKYASFPLTASFFFLYTGKILLGKHNQKEKMKTLSVFFLGFLVGYIPLDLYGYMAKQSTLFTKISDYSTALISDGRAGFAVDSPTKFFSLSYLKKNLQAYTGVLQGQSISIILGHPFPTVLGFIALYAWVGFIAGLFNGRFRYLVFSLVFMLAASIIFISTFIEFDLRYVYHLIPTLILGFGIFLDLTNKFCKRLLAKKYFYLGLVGLLFIYLGQAKVLFGYRGDTPPMDYAAIIVLNRYFSKASGGLSKQAKVITAVPPYFIDFYSSGSYKLLPLSKNQHFIDKAEAVWGPDDYSDLYKLYTKYLDNGYDLYIQRAGILNVAYHADYMKILLNFKPELVLEGCNKKCNLYRLHTKSK